MPAVWQWKNHFPAGAVTNDWAATVDILPTMLEAAGLEKPAAVKFDGLSLLSLLTSSGTAVASSGSGKTVKPSHHLRDKVNSTDFSMKGRVIAGENAGVSALKSRMFLWHKDTERYSDQEDRYQSAGYFEDVKVITSGHQGCVIRIFDLKHDPFEHHNIAGKAARACEVSFGRFDAASIGKIVNSESAKAHCDGDGSGVVKVDPEACMKKFHRNIALKVEVCLFTF